MKFDPSHSAHLLGKNHTFLISFLVQGLFILHSLLTSLTIISQSNNCFFFFSNGLLTLLTLLTSPAVKHI